MEIYLLLLFFFNLLVILLSHNEILTGNSFLFDLSIDPNESKNEFNNQTYSSKLSSFESRVLVWSKKTGSPDIPSEFKMKTAWKKANGIVPWIDDSTKRNVSIKFQASNPPNIVFFLVDDWGYNDVGYQSTYLNWTTPTIDKLASEGIKLSNYYTHDLCTPSRGAFLTGRYALRLGLAYEREGGELPLSEVTIGEELQSAGYRTYLIGKWHVGHSSLARTPTYRGFDYFYGFYNGYVDYWTKEYSGYLDLHENQDLVSDTSEISSDLHNAYLLERKAEEAIWNHSIHHPDQPMFLYMSSQLIHEDWAAPSHFITRCSELGATSDQALYCAMNLMLDEVIANLTCALQASGLGDNTVLVVSSDNGGSGSMAGNSYPFRGHKGSLFRGGVSAAAFVHSPLLPPSQRGKTFDFQAHITDWLPTFMYLASDGQWEESLGGSEVELDGVNLWSGLLGHKASSHSELVFMLDEEGNCTFQLDMIKYMITTDLNTYQKPEHYFSDSLSISSDTSCSNPTLLNESEVDTVPHPSSISTHSLVLAILALCVSSIVLALLALSTKSPLSLVHNLISPRPFPPPNRLPPTHRFSPHSISFKKEEAQPLLSSSPSAS